jgi:hypothetical protein
MAGTVLRQKSTDPLVSYAELRRRVRETLLCGQPGQAAIRRLFERRLAAWSSGAGRLARRGSIKQARQVGPLSFGCFSHPLPASGEDTRAGDIKIFARSPQSKGIEGIYLNNLLLETGHARLKTDWSLGDWEG